MRPQGTVFPKGDGHQCNRNRSYHAFTRMVWSLLIRILHSQIDWIFSLEQVCKNLISHLEFDIWGWIPRSTSCQGWVFSSKSTTLCAFSALLLGGNGFVGHSIDILYVIRYIRTYAHISRYVHTYSTCKCMYLFCFGMCLCTCIYLFEFFIAVACFENSQNLHFASMIPGFFPKGVVKTENQKTRHWLTLKIDAFSRFTWNANTQGSHPIRKKSKEDPQ